MGDPWSPYEPRSTRPPGDSPKASTFFREKPDDESQRPLVLRPQDAAKALGISTSTLNRLVRAGEIQCIRLDHMTLYPVAVLHEWLKTKLETQNTKGDVHEGS